MFISIFGGDASKKLTSTCIYCKHAILNPVAESLENGLHFDKDGWKLQRDLAELDEKDVTFVVRQVAATCVVIAILAL